MNLSLAKKIAVIAAALVAIATVGGCANPALPPAVSTPSPIPTPQASPALILETAAPSPSPSSAPETGPQYNWRIVGEGQLPYEMPGMIGTGTIIVTMDLHKQGGSTPAGAYTGSFSVWHNEMTPELMAQYGATGDSYNEYVTDSFTMEIVPKAGDAPWFFQTDGEQKKAIVIDSITDVYIAGRHQQVSDYPERDLKYVVKIDPDTGVVEFSLNWWSFTSFVYEFRIEKSDL